MGAAAGGATLPTLPLLPPPPGAVALTETGAVVLTETGGVVRVVAGASVAGVGFDFLVVEAGAGAGAFFGAAVGLCNKKTVFVGARVDEGFPVGRGVPLAELGFLTIKTDLVGERVGPVGTGKVGKNVGLIGRTDGAAFARGRGVLLLLPLPLPLLEGEGLGLGLGFGLVEVPPFVLLREPPFELRPGAVLLRGAPPEAGARLMRAVGPRLARGTEPDPGASLVRAVGPRLERAVGPRFVRRVGPRFVRAVGPRFVRRVGPRLVRAVGPRFVRRVGPRLVRDVGPRFVRRVGPRLAPETHLPLTLR